jgi:hypothetical protein
VASGTIYQNGVPVAPKIVQSGLIAEYPFTDGLSNPSSTTLTDISGNGYNGTIMSSTTLPTWIPTTGGLSFNLNGYVSLPQAVSSAKTIELFLAPNYLANYDDIGAIGANVSSGITVSYNTVSNPYGGPTMILRGHGGSTYLSTIVTGMGQYLLTYAMSSSSVGDTFYINGTALVNGINGGVSTGTIINAVGGNWNYQIGGSCSTCAVPPQQDYFSGNIYYALFYSQTLTAQQVAQNNTAVDAILGARGIYPIAGQVENTSSLSLLVAEGDSLTASNGLFTAYMAYLSSSTLGLLSTTTYNQNWTIAETAIAGIRASQNAVFDPTYTYPYYSTTNSANFIVLWEGTNDLQNTPATTPAQTWQIERNQILADKAVGFNVACVSLLNRTSNQANQAAFNQIMRANWQGVCNEFIDMGSDPNLGANGAGLASTTWFQGDGTHPNTTSSQYILAPLIAQGVNRFYACNNPAPTYTTSTNYVWGNNDCHLNVDPANATGSMTITLPTAVGYTGQDISITNISTSTTNTVTIMPTSSSQFDGGSVPNQTTSTFTEAINGNPSITLAPGNGVTLISVLIASSTGGATWQIANTVQNQNIVNTGSLTVSGMSALNSVSTQGIFQMSGSGTVITPSIGGTITGDGCDSATTSISSTVTSSTAKFIITPQNDPGAEALSDEAFVSAPGVLTVRVCSAVTTTPNTTPYVVGIIK